MTTLAKRFPLPSRTLGVLGLGRVKLEILGFRLGAVGKLLIRFFSSSSSKGAFKELFMFSLGSVECSVENASNSSSSIARRAAGGRVCSTGKYMSGDGCVWLDKTTTSFGRLEKEAKKGRPTRCCWLSCSPLATHSTCCAEACAANSPSAPRSLSQPWSQARGVANLGCRARRTPARAPATRHHHRHAEVERCRRKCNPPLPAAP